MGPLKCTYLHTLDESSAIKTLIVWRALGCVSFPLNWYILYLVQQTKQVYGSFHYQFWNIPSQFKSHHSFYWVSSVNAGNWKVCLAQLLLHYPERCHQGWQYYTWIPTVACSSFCNILEARYKILSTSLLEVVWNSSSTSWNSTSCLNFDAVFITSCKI